MNDPRQRLRIRFIYLPLYFIVKFFFFFPKKKKKKKKRKLCVKKIEGGKQLLSKFEKMFS